MRRDLAWVTAILLTLSHALEDAVELMQLSIGVTESAQFSQALVQRSSGSHAVIQVTSDPRNLLRLGGYSGASGDPAQNNASIVSSFHRPSVTVIGTSQCTDWSDGVNFRNSFKSSLPCPLGCNISFDCEAHRRLVEPSKANVAGHQRTVEAAMDVALDACASGSNLIVVFVGLTDISDEFFVDTTLLRNATKQLVNAVATGCKSMPRLVLAVPPLEPNVDLPTEMCAKDGNGSTVQNRTSCGLERISVLRDAFRQSADEHANFVSFVDAAPPGSLPREAFCNVDTDKCDGFHFCRMHKDEPESCEGSVIIADKLALEVAEILKLGNQHVMGFVRHWYAIAMVVLAVAYFFGLIIVCASTDPLAQQTTQLPHVTGFRFFASFWIVADHFLSPTPDTQPFLQRGPVAVSFFVVLSGFITHMAYGTRVNGGIMQFYARRIGRILLMYYFALLFSFGLRRAGLVADHQPWNSGWMLLPMLMLQAWAALGTELWCLLNGPLWTISALIFAWLLYPYIVPFLTGSFWSPPSQTAITGPTSAASCVRALRLWAFWMPMLVLLMQIPALAAIATGSMPSGAMATVMRTWPPFVLLEFLVGAATAEIVRQRQVPHWAGAFVDVIATLILLSTISTPMLGSRRNFEVFFTTGSSLLWALLLACSTAETKSLFTRLASHKIFVGLGEYSFHVYTLQEPLAQLLYGAAAGFPVPRYVRLPPGLFALFASALWLAAGIFAEVFEQPYALWLKRVTEAKKPQPLS